MEIGTVAALWRYPASSLAGEKMNALSILRGNVLGDRRFGLFDVSTGEIARPDGDAKWHPVPRIRTRTNGDGELEIAVPDGVWLPALAMEAGEALSRFLGFAAEIRPFGHRAGNDGKTDEPRYEAAPIHLLTTASLARLKALHPQGNPDPRRFRPNILIDMPEIEGSFPETEWIGRRMTIGDVELTVAEPCRRCGFTIISQDGIEEDAGILRSLLRHNSRNIGVYCTVDRAGDIAVSQTLSLH